MDDPCLVYLGAESALIGTNLWDDLEGRGDNHCYQPGEHVVSLDLNASRYNKFKTNCIASTRSGINPCISPGVSLQTSRPRLILSMSKRITSPFSSYIVYFVQWYT